MVRRQPSDAVIVITGASSGIGRATALRFASEGATLVLGARRENVLRALAAECDRKGGRATAVKVDVTQEDEVQNLARQAIENFGRIDVWVNNAGVMLFGRLEDVPLDAFRQVIETNLLGTVNGARAVLPWFHKQGSGVMINTSSVYGDVGSPYLTAYIASKFAVRGFSASLRQELRDEKNIHVCTILPASIDTPLFQHAGNYTGRIVKPVRPVYDADVVAKQIVELVANPQPETFAGRTGHLIGAQRRLMPVLTENMMNMIARAGHLQDEPAGPNPGNLFEPVAFGAGISGGWQASASTRIKRRVALIGAFAAIPAFFAWRKLASRTSS